MKSPLIVMLKLNLSSPFRVFKFPLESASRNFTRAATEPSFFSQLLLLPLPLPLIYGAHYAGWEPLTLLYFSLIGPSLGFTLNCKFKVK